MFRTAHGKYSDRQTAWQKEGVPHLDGKRGVRTADDHVTVAHPAKQLRAVLETFNTAAAKHDTVVCWPTAASSL